MIVSYSNDNRHVWMTLWSRQYCARATITGIGIWRWRYFFECCTYILAAFITCSGECQQLSSGVLVNVSCFHQVFWWMLAALIICSEECQLSSLGVQGNVSYLFHVFRGMPCFHQVFRWTSVAFILWSGEYLLPSSNEWHPICLPHVFKRMSAAFFTYSGEYQLTLSWAQVNVIVAAFSSMCSII